jgi:hypothetical protein
VARKLDTYWWKKNKDQLPETVNSIVTFLQKQQNYVTEENVKHMKLYGNADIFGLSAMDYAPASANAYQRNNLTLNVIKSCVDTITNKIGKNRPRPMFLTSGGDWAQQQLAEQLTAYNDGLFYLTKIYEVLPMVFRDGCIFNTGGFAKIYREERDIKIERVHNQELFFDDIEAYYGKYSNLYQLKYYPRDVLIDMFPSKKNLILNAPDAEVRYGVTQSLSDQIHVIEAWKLASKNALGKHAIVIPNGILVEDDWKYDYFPFVQFQWSAPLFGARGQSLAEELTGIQVEINRILRTIQQILRLTVPKLFVEKGAKVVYSHLNNDIGGIVEFSGTKPVYDFLQAIPPDLYAQLDRLYSRAFEIAGISQLSAQALKPAGLDSGKALRVYNDLETERFILKAQAYENMYLEASRQMINLAREIADEYGSLKIKVPNRKGIEQIDWKEVDLEEDSYIMRLFPTSSLSQTPAGRLADVQELLQAGFISREDGLKLLDFPDLETTMSLANAAVEDIMSTIDNMVKKGIYQAPEPLQNLEYGIGKCQSAYLRAKLNKVPEERLELLRRWIEEASALLQSMQAPAPMPGPMPEQAPLGVPEAAPVSEMLPLPTV